MALALSNFRLNARMKVVSFQLQLRSSKADATQLIHKIDPRAPIPEPLEGGDGKGPLYQCILDKGKEEDLMMYWKEGRDALVYTFLYTIEIEEDLYRPDNYVRWQFGKDTTVEQR